jgi:competence protein ComEC
MPRSSRFSGTTDAEREGGALVAASLAALITVGLCNLAPPGYAWWAALLPAAVTAVVLGLLRWPGGRVWWVTAGICVGALAGALAPRAPSAAPASGVPVRALLAVRDGWQAGEHGWSTRVRLEEATVAGSAFRCARELWLTLPANVQASALPAPGSRWEAAGELVYRRGWPLRRPQLRVKSEHLLQPLAGRPSVDRLREAGMEALRRAAGADPERLRAAGLAAALVLGRTEAVAPGEVDSMRRSGLAHLLAVSGLNVGLVGAFVWGVLLALRVQPARRRWVVAVAILAFAALAGSGAPVRRAAFAGAAYIGARQLGRPLLSLPVVWAVVATIALLEPDAVLQAGFQLSAVVTLALVRWAAPLADRLSALPRWLAVALAVAIIGQGASASLVGQHFGTLSLLGVAANLAAAPLAFALTVLSLIALGGAAVSQWLGRAVLAAIAPLHVALDAISRAASSGVLEFPELTFAAGAAATAMGVIALGRNRVAAVAALGSVALWVGWVAMPGRSVPGRSEVRLLPVPDGMSVLVSGPGGAVLFDAGRSATAAGRSLAALRMRRLDALVLTHPDADHVGGAARILDRLRVGALVYPALAANHPTLVALRRAARARAVAERAVTAGMRIVAAGMPCDVLWPPNDSGVVAANDASLVVRVHAGGLSVLVTGDLESAGESHLLARGGTLRADVLQLPHHGSATSSGMPFLLAVRPRLALAASGDSPRYPYPTRAVLARLRSLPAIPMSQRDGAREVAWQQEEDSALIDGAVSIRLRQEAP